MLQLLRIKDFVIIEDQQVEFTDGLNVLSGETGSGKSLILEAFRLVLGGRVSGDYFRKDTAGWQVEAVFDLSELPSQVRDLLPDVAKDGDELIVSRSMSVGGKGRVFINGALGSLSLLQKITPHVMALCTQGQKIQLTNSSYLRELLDEYGDLTGERSAYEEIFNKEQQLRKELSELREKKESLLMKKAELEFVINELEALAPEKGLRELLETEIKSIENERSNHISMNKVGELLMGEVGVLSLLSQCRAELEGVSHKDLPKWQELCLELDDRVSTLEQSVRSAIASNELDGEAKLEAKQERLSELARLERKFGTDDEGLTLIFENALKSREDSEGDKREEELEGEISTLREDLIKRAAQLSKKRRAVAKELEGLVGIELAELGMKGAEISIHCNETELTQYGAENIEFFFRPNVGEEGRSLGSIASGGELSRVMLVLKKLFRDKTGVSILVFDEVDSGISGAVAEAVGRKLGEISKFSQVVCITHLPQVACFADQHLVIRKENKHGSEGDTARTRTMVELVRDEEKVEEIARMLAGYKITPAARASARELLSSKGTGQ